MKLSQIVSYKNSLENLMEHNQARELLTKELQHLVDFSKKMPLDTEVDWATTLAKDYQAILDHTDRFNHDFDQMITSLISRLDALEPSYFLNSYHLYSRHLIMETAKSTLARSIYITPEQMEFVKSRATLYNDWKTVGVIVRPGKSDLIETMVACDPLYVMDLTHDLLSPSRERFNQQYQNRVCWYTIKERFSGGMFNDLPDKQIGFIMCHGFFHFKPLEIIKLYLRESFEKLKPGGIMAFSFNDCDRHKAVELVEKNFMCYTPGRLLVSLCESIGFDIKLFHKLNESSSWVELEKPGSVQSIKGGQSLAKILPKNISKRP